MLESVPDSYLNQQMCDKAVDNYPHALEFVPDCYKTQKCVINYTISYHAFTILKNIPEIVRSYLVQNYLKTFCIFRA